VLLLVPTLADGTFQSFPAEINILTSIGPDMNSSVFANVISSM
jgi:hypothetical protein